MRDLRKEVGAFRRRVYHALEVEEDDIGLDRAINIGLMTLIIVNVAAVILETVPEFHSRFDLAFDALEAVSVGIFTLEYALRVWSCVEHPTNRGGFRGRMRFMITPLALVDLAAVVPAYLPGDPFLDLRYARIVRLIRMLRLLKLGRYSRTVRTFARVAKARSADLGLIFVFLILLLVLASSSMFFVEHRAQPDVFTSIPASMWWAIETLTTVGYGDMVPITPMGKLLGALIAVIGIGFFALPTGVLAASFAEELTHSRLAKATCPHCGEPLLAPDAKERHAS
jgi:voltage-gated potassium channel